METEDPEWEDLGWNEKEKEILQHWDSMVKIGASHEAAVTEVTTQYSGEFTLKVQQELQRRLQLLQNSHIPGATGA